MRSKVCLDWNEKAFFDEFACSCCLVFDWWSSWDIAQHLRNLRSNCLKCQKSLRHKTFYILTTPNRFAGLFENYIYKLNIFTCSHTLFPNNSVGSSRINWYKKIKLCKIQKRSNSPNGVYYYILQLRREILSNENTRTAGKQTKQNKKWTKRTLFTCPIMNY